MRPAIYPGLLAALALSGCGTLLPVSDLAAPGAGSFVVPSVAPPEASPLRKGDRLSFEWVSRMGGVRDVAEVELEVDQVGGREESDDLPDDLGAILDGLIAEWNEVTDTLQLERDGDEDLPSLSKGMHSVALRIRHADATELADPFEFPVHLEGHGALLAGERIRARMVGQRAVCTTREAMQILFDYAALVWVYDAETAALKALPGLWEMTDRVERPSLLRWLFCGCSLDFPLWDGTRLDEFRMQVPFRLRSGSMPMLVGVVELARPDGPLCLTGGITGLRLWLPGAPEEDVTLRLVKCERGEASQSPSIAATAVPE